MFNGWKTLGPIGSAVGLCLWVAAPMPGNAASSPYVVKNVNAQGSSEPGEFIAVGGRVYFRADDGVQGSELWRSDGSATGTVLVADVNPGSSSSGPASFTPFAGRVFLSATSPVTGREVWFADERHEGARLLKDINPGPGDGIDPLGFHFLSVSDRLYFPALNEFGLELWVSDGTPQGTRLIKDVHSGVASSIPVFMTPFRGDVLFAADDRYTPSLLCWDRELWRSDGTAAGTMRVKDINGGPCASVPMGLTRLGSDVLFSATDGVLGAELWRTNGTEHGTVLVKDINPGAASSFPMHLRWVGGHLFFAADGGEGLELWKTDGSERGTTRVKDINPGPQPSMPLAITPFRQGVLFAADDALHGHELWFSDGTEQGTRLLADIVPGPIGSAPADVIAVGSEAYFTVRVDFDPRDGTAGTELWRTNGTTSGTRRVWRAPGRFPGRTILYPAASRFHLFFSAPTGVDAAGRSADFEPHAIRIEQSRWL